MILELFIVLLFTCYGVECVDPEPVPMEDNDYGIEQYYQYDYCAVPWVLAGQVIGYKYCSI